MNLFPKSKNKQLTQIEELCREPNKEASIFVGKLLFKFLACPIKAIN
jgi:hypothetical protein